MDTLLVVFSLFLHFIYSVECLKCLQCSSISDMGCKSGAATPIPCYNESFVYCLKYETIHEKVKFVTRDCSEKFESGCYKVPMPTERNKQVTVCRESCSEDGCNSAPATPLRSSRDMYRIVLTCAMAAILRPFL